MRILITRPVAEAEGMKALLAAAGHEVDIAPLLEIALADIPGETVRDAAGLIATSRNGLRALERAGSLDAARLKPLFTVGPATSALARAQGFADIREGAGKAAGLVPLIERARIEFRGRTLVHLAGEHVAFDLKSALEPIGQPVLIVTAYRQVAAKSLTGNVLAGLSQGEFDTIILMSPRTARVWSDLAKASGIEEISRKMTHVCLSPAVAEGIGLDPKPPLAIARQPNGEEIVALIHRLANSPRTE
jgi:uroporphyrinogen-III synthase